MIKMRGVTFAACHYAIDGRRAPIARERKSGPIERGAGQERPWTKIEFRNVSLHRGQKTNLGVFLDGKPYEPKAGHTSSFRQGTAFPKRRPNSLCVFVMSR
jgi:hypothetical protein